MTSQLVEWYKKADKTKFELVLVSSDRTAAKIQCANLDGSNVEDLVSELDFPKGIALSANKMYWTDSTKIKSANLDGSNVEVIVSGLSSPFRIALQTSAGKMYWTDSASEKIQRANLDGSDIEDLITELEFPTGIAFDPGTQTM